MAPLNWGLGHATRCIPIIKALIKYNFTPIIASDGIALDLLKKEFSHLLFYELPSYNITYPKKANNFKLKLLKDSPRLLNTINKERKAVDAIVKSEHIAGIISDNRFGVRHKTIPSVFITHQLRVMSGSTTWLSSKLHQRIISKFNECWVPDYSSSYNLSGDLGHIDSNHLNLKYIGSLSRFNPNDQPIDYKLLVVLSGPEPQRTILEQKLLRELQYYNGDILFIKGKIESQQEVRQQNHITIYNYMTSKELEDVMNKSEIVLCRSGYTSIMDLDKLSKKVFFIPTPGQYEQEYLAKKFKKENIAPFCSQDKFELQLLSDIGNYKGFSNNSVNINYSELFSLF
ncbi:glycosyltransferase [Winogradskyella sp.]|uniref:glycosyltransferase n=1 Tax=Winogradskyella sp. TaxID=1883156 RepID=UPI003F6B676F